MKWTRARSRGIGDAHEAYVAAGAAEQHWDGIGVDVLARSQSPALVEGVGRAQLLFYLLAFGNVGLRREAGEHHIHRIAAKPIATRAKATRE